MVGFLPRFMASLLASVAYNRLVTPTTERAMSIWQQIKKTSTDFALMLLFGSLGALIPAVFGWWALPAMGVAAIILLVVLKAFGLLDRRILTRQRRSEVDSGSPT